MRINSISVTSNGILIAWYSKTNKLYAIQRTSDLASGFTNVAEHVLATPPQNNYLDVAATNGASFFYRLKVE